MNNELQNQDAIMLASDSNAFTDYLKCLGLPSDNVIANTSERYAITQAIPTFLEKLPEEVKRDARYLSKFVGAVTIGLFDAALNYIWNEVVLVLRQKAIAYGIDLFLDAAIGGPNRSAYKTDEDLSNLKDAHLIDTCAKLELTSPITVKKIKHILDMRNEIAASHPNVEQIGGYELLGWLDTCVTDILKDSQSQSAIQVQSFIGNLKSYTSPIDDTTKSELLNRIKNLATAHIHNLVFTFFN